jgi:toxin ParE1/3/4
MRIRWTGPARADLISHTDYLAQEDPTIADRLQDAIFHAVDLLSEYPRRGRPGWVQGTREIVLPDFPYIIVYEIQATDIHILRVWHGKQNWRK